MTLVLVEVARNINTATVDKPNQNTKAAFSMKVLLFYFIMNISKRFPL